MVGVVYFCCVRVGVGGVLCVVSKGGLGVFVYVGFVYYVGIVWFLLFEIDVLIVNDILFVFDLLFDNFNSVVFFDYVL